MLKNFGCTQLKSTLLYDQCLTSVETSANYTEIVFT